MPYWGTLSARFRTLIQYRAAALAGFSTQIFWGLLKIMVLEAFYRSANERALPMQFSQAVSYIWLGQAMWALLPWSVDPEIRELVKKGGLSYELLRPADVYGLWFARTLALRTAPTVLRALPILIFSALVLPQIYSPWSLSLPLSGVAVLVWVSSTLAALLLGCAITSFVHATLPLTVSGDGIVRFVPSVVLLFSGMILPLPLFPDVVQPLLRVLPFRWLVDMPFRTYIGHVSPGEALIGCGSQLLWTVAMVIAGRALLARALRRAELFGG